MNAGSTVTEARILIVDDEESVVLLLERMLRQDGYTNVVSTTDPRQALPLFETFRPDLLLLDVMMPYLDGLEVLEELKPSMSPGPHVPTMMITADVSGDVKRRALVAGVDDFVTKPFSLNEVLIRVRFLLETRIRRLAAQEQELRVIPKIEAPRTIRV
ncbi:MAG: response regulator [Actinomycetota bacterium]